MTSASRRVSLPTGHPRYSADPQRTQPALIHRVALIAAPHVFFWRWPPLATTKGMSPWLQKNIRGLHRLLPARVQGGRDPPASYHLPVPGVAFANPVQQVPHQPRRPPWPQERWRISRMLPAMTTCAATCSSATGTRQGTANETTFPPRTRRACSMTVMPTRWDHEAPMLPTSHRKIRRTRITSEPGVGRQPVSAFR